MNVYNINVAVLVLMLMLILILIRILEYMQVPSPYGIVDTQIYTCVVLKSLHGHGYWYSEVQIEYMYL